MTSPKEVVIEGYLEKHSTGVSRFLGKSTIWCALQGSCLQYGKENKRSSVVDCIQLSEAQMVRKTSQVKQGTQLEIVMKKQKTHMFTAASAEECGQWVRHLQQAMVHEESATQKISSSGSSLKRSPLAEHGYEQIDISPHAKPTFGLNQRVGRPPAFSTGSYAEVADAIPSPCNNSRSADVGSSEGEYAEVSDVTKPREWSGAVPGSSLYSKAWKVIEDLDEHQLNQSDDIANHYAIVDNYSALETERGTGAALGDESNSQTPVYAQVNKVRRTAPGTDVQPMSEINGHSTDTYGVNTFEIEPREGAAIEKLDMELKRLPLSSAPPEWTSLTADDRQPLDELTAFLANNPELCRLSVSRLSDLNEDPVMKMKRLVQTIG